MYTKLLSIIVSVRFDQLVQDSERATTDHHSETMRAGRSPETLADNVQTHRLMIREKSLELVEG